MSWFADFAGKAEDLLNKVDKTAAVALQNQKSEDVDRTLLRENVSSNYKSSYSIESESTISKTIDSTLLVPTRQATTEGLAKSTVYSASASNSNRLVPNKTDDQLLEFLNTPAKSESAKPRLSSPPPKSNPMSLKTKPSISMDTSAQVKLLEFVDSSENSIVEDEVKQGDSISEVIQPELEISDILSDAMADVSASLADTAMSDSISIAMQMSNTGVSKNASITTNSEHDSLLKKEIELLNREVSSLEKRNRDADGENKRLKKQLEHWNSQISGCETVIRDLRERESDLTTALSAKDAQLAVLRVRMEEYDGERKTLKAAYDQLKTENERLHQEHTHVISIHHEALESLKQKFQSSEAALHQEQEVRSKTETEVLKQYSNLEEENHKLMENLSLTQKQLLDHKGQIKDVNQQLQSCRVALDTSRQDLSEYRLKAQRILQSKEKLISTLKENRTAELSEESFNDLDLSARSGGISLSEATDDLIQKENTSIREELHQSQAACELLKAEVRDLEYNFHTEMESSRENHRVVQIAYKEEKQRKEELESEIFNQKEELKFLREDLTRTKTNMQTRIKDRDIEVEKLRKQLTTKSLSSSSEVELESRIRSLTENLIQKQTLVETLSTEKNSLVMQLERLEQKVKDIPSIGLKGATHIVGISDDSAKNRLPVIFNENPFDGNMTRRVKHAYGAVDSLSIRMGSFLRRYPASRAFLLAYMALLHLWVLAVLVTYQPEIHGKHNKNNTGL